MRIIFRADASRKIGAGHVMRSSVLAEEAIQRGYECIFVGSVTGLSWVSGHINALGFAQIIEDENLFVPKIESDVLIIDSYSIPISDSFIVKSNWKLVLSICDESTPRYESDIELRPGLARILGSDNGKLVLSGPEYILVRKGIEKNRVRTNTTEALKVLIMGGGSDPFGFVPSITKFLSSLQLKLEVHLFSNTEISEKSTMTLINHQVGSELDRVAGEVDVVFCTASTSSLEFIAREIPTGVVCSIDNQNDYYAQLGELGFAAQLGYLGLDGKWVFNLQEIRALLENRERRDTLAKATHMLIDLHGAARVIDILELMSVLSSN